MIKSLARLLGILVLSQILVNKIVPSHCEEKLYDAGYSGLERELGIVVKSYASRLCSSTVPSHEPQLLNFVKIFPKRRYEKNGEKNKDFGRGYIFSRWDVPC